MELKSGIAQVCYVGQNLESKERKSRTPTMVHLHLLCIGMYLTERDKKGKPDLPLRDAFETAVL